MPPDRITVRAPDVGGGFGVKNFLYPEWVLVLWAARRLGRPVKWVAERGEEFISSAQGRDNHTRARLALDKDGRFLALDVDTVANLGAYLSTNGPGSSTNSPASAMGGVYDIPAVFMAVSGVFTNTLPIDAYRGAGKPEANFLIERLVDHAARRLGVDPIALRRRNLISRFPYRSGLGVTIDCGRFAANLGEMAQRLLTDGFAARRAAAAERGRLRGLGIACFLETSRGTPGERAEIRFEADGRIALVLGTQSNGQGHETSFCADRRRFAGAADCRLQFCPGRHEGGQERQWARRRPLDAYGRHCAVPGGADGAVQGPRLPPTCCRPMRAK
jgi:carbon-monoxide dehydrogenase large subunit